MLDLTENQQDIVRGYSWPTGGNATITLNNPGTFDGGEEDWTWRLLFDQSKSGEDPDITVEIDTVTKTDSTTLVLSFTISPADTEALTGTGTTNFFVDLESEDGTGDKKIWSQAYAKATVRDAVGDGVS